MRVLLLGPYPPPNGGVQTNLVAIRSFLLQREIPCLVINITRHRKPDLDEVYYPKSPAGVFRLLAKLQYDIIHLHIGGMLTKRLLALSLVCAQWPCKKSVMTFHSGGFPSSPEGQALSPSSFAGFVLRRFDGVIAVNEEILRFLQRMGVRPHRARVISPFSFTATGASRELLPGPLADFFAAHDPVLMSVGLLEPEYDLPLQIEAISPIRQRYPRAGLLLIGSGSLESDLRAKIAASLSAEHILLAGDVSHPATIEAIRKSQLMLRTTLYDGDALSVREALHLGTPIIASDNGMRPAGVHLIPKSDPQALLVAINQELQKPATRMQVSTTGEKNLQAVFEFYQELLNGKIL